MRTIRWQKWYDPLQPLVDGKIVPIPDHQEEDEDFYQAQQSWDADADIDTRPNPYPRSNQNGNTGPVVMTPFGIVPVLESNLPGHLFNFWSGDTNFDLTEDVVNTIERVTGVETLDVFTRYRFRLGIGRAFRAKHVMDAIDLAVCPAQYAPKPKAAEPPDPLASMKRRLSKTFPFWAIVKREKNVQCVGGETADEVRQKLLGIEGEPILSWE